MAQNYAKTVSPKRTPQTKKLPGSNQKRNNAGGFSDVVTIWQQLDRFLILGAAGGTYYVRQDKLIEQNYDVVLQCLKEDGVRVVSRVVEISQGGRAPKNDPAIFVLVLASDDEDLETKKAAYAAVTAVCRTATHLFTFLAYAKELRGRGSGFRRAISRFYTERTVENLAYQMVKYRNREGYTHRDVLRLLKIRPDSDARNSLFKWAVGKSDTCPIPVVEGFIKIQALKEGSFKQAASLITKYKLPWEAVPTWCHKDASVWNCMLPDMGITALLRNLARLTAVGSLKSNLDETTQLVCARLTSLEELKKGRLHPIAILNALRVYQSGHGDKGSLSWSPISNVTDALEKAFHLAFEVVEPSNKRIFIGLDVSGSMFGNSIAGTALDAATAAGAMALVTVKTEPQVEVYSFSSASGSRYATVHKNPLNGLEPFPMGKVQTLNGVMKKMEEYSARMSGTDCALPIKHCYNNSLVVDAFVIYTDSETWDGDKHVTQALKEYRAKFNPKAKLVVVGTTSTEFTIADPNDPYSLDVVGFDTAAPGIISDFIAERI